MKDKIDQNPDELEQYIKDVFCEDNTIDLESVSVRYKKIKLQSLVNYNGYFINITGKSGKQVNFKKCNKYVC